MKHNFKVTIILFVFFILSQLFGLFVISYDMKEVIDQETNETVIQLSETAIGERPELEGINTIYYLSFAIFFGTILILILAKFKKRPLLNDLEEARKLYKQRIKEYKKVADITINVEDWDIKRITKEILKRVQ